MNFAEPLKTIADNVPKVYQAGYDDGAAAGGGGANPSEIVENLPIALDFSDGDQEIVAPDGVLVKSAIIQKPETLNPENIAEGVNIAGIVGTLAAGGGTSDELCYVTFMSYDGSVEYGKKAVAVGDDCADPIARGIFNTPTRESDAQYNYTFYGWATEVNGAADSNWNKSITEDKTVYANFASAVRYYTITYYDSDGTTVLKTESLAYGTVPSYVPTKSGYDFAGWEQELAAVTGEASYTATWTEEVSFATSSWARIAEISEAGEAEKYFAVGETKTLAFTYNGTTENVSARIIGFNHDDLADGSGKAGISIALAQGLENVPQITENANYEDSYIWENSKTRTALNSGAYYTGLPSDLRAVLKSVTKTSNAGYSKEYGGREKNSLYTTTDKVWMLSTTEVGMDNAYSSSYVALGQGEVYEYYATSAQTRRKMKTTANKDTIFPTRSMQSQYSSTSVMWSGRNGSAHQGELGADYRARMFGFCI